MENLYIKYEGLDYNPRCTAEQFFQLEHTPVYAVFESEECYYDFMFTAERFGITWAGSGARAVSYDPGYNGGNLYLVRRGTEFKYSEVTAMNAEEKLLTYIITDRAADASFDAASDDEFLSLLT